MRTQWECVLQNLGEWEGSFTRLSPTGELLEDIKSVISLTGVNNNQTIHLALRRYYPTHPGSTEMTPQDMVFDFSAPGSGALFFDSGAFSEGSPYFGSGAPFGAEFSFIEGDRRMRLIQQYNPSSSQLDRLTLVREQRVGTAAPERPGLTLDDLIGEWQGEAVTMYRDGRASINTGTRVKCDRHHDLVVQKNLSEGEERECRMAQALDSNESRLNFEQDSQQYQVLLLPDGAISICPTQITPGHPFFLEVGWLIQPGLRQRIIRTYNEAKWTSLTWINERRIG